MIAPMINMARRTRLGFGGGTLVREELGLDGKATPGATGGHRQAF